MKTKKILVLCTGNSCRSQIAEGYLRYFAGDKAIIYSAGVETHGVNPRAIATMQEDGIDISMHTSNNMDEYRDIDFDYVITVVIMRENAPKHAKKFIIDRKIPAIPSNLEIETIEAPASQGVSLLAKKLMYLL